jgi:hypothetical protein
MERAIQRKHPEVKRIFLEVNSLDGQRSLEANALRSPAACAGASR